jgi:glycosyltransferase involved in cell wall biosynthesis
VAGFSARPRGRLLAVLGGYDDGNAYHRAVRAAAGAEVRFLGAIYDKAVVQALRFHSLAYVHGHQVGGTNPSLVEALGADNAIVAHDNRFNRWVSGDGAVYFSNTESFSGRMDEYLTDTGLNQLHELRRHAQQRFQALFTWPAILLQYEELLTLYLPRLVAR